MAQSKSPTPGTELATQLFHALGEADRVPVSGARDLPVLEGITQAGASLGSAENALVEATDLLVATSRIYSYGNSVVMELRLDAKNPILVPLRTDSVVMPAAKRLLANIFFTSDGKLQFTPPESFVGTLLLAEPLLSKLPCIGTYSKRPIFDSNFNLCGPGWHPDEGILVHGPAIDPAPFQPPDPSLPAIERLPFHLRTLLGGFCFRSPADLANALGILLTGLLMHHFIVSGKPLVLVDGNQVNVGKSWFVRVLGILLDGCEPRLIRYTPDEEELQKSVCATLRETSTSVVFIDNAKDAGSAGVSK